MRPLLSVLLLVCACKDKTSEPAKTTGTPPSTASAKTGPPAVDTKPPTDAAYVGVEGTGVVRIVDGKAKTIVAHKYPVEDIVVDAKGVAYAAAIGGAWTIRGEEVTPLPEAEPHVSYNKLAIGPDGVLWAMSRDTVYSWDGKTWTVQPKEVFDKELLNDITVDKTGRPWVASSDHLIRLDGTAWTKLDNKFTGTKQPFFRGLAAGPNGEVYATGSAGTFIYEADAWKKVPMNRSGSIITPDDLAVGVDGRLSSSGGMDDLATRAPTGEINVFTIKKSGAKAARATVLAVDASGRTWLRSDNGVIILGADGMLVQQWLPGTVTGISGKVESIAIAGKGPKLPELTAAARGTVVGKIIHAGKPVANAAIEMCSSPAAMMFENTPCTGAPEKFTATTGTDGTFSIANVPVGSYGIAVKPKKTWFVTWGTDQCCNEMENGGTFDMGSLKLDKLE